MPFNPWAESRNAGAKRRKNEMEASKTGASPSPETPKPASAPRADDWDDWSDPQAADGDSTATDDDGRSDDSAKPETSAKPSGDDGWDGWAIPWMRAPPDPRPL